MRESLSVFGKCVLSFLKCRSLMPSLHRHYWATHERSAPGVCWIARRSDPDQRISGPRIHCALYRALALPQWQHFQQFYRCQRGQQASCSAPILRRNELGWWKQRGRGRRETSHQDWARESHTEGFLAQEVILCAPSASTQACTATGCAVFSLNLRRNSLEGDVWYCLLPQIIFCSSDISQWSVCFFVCDLFIVTVAIEGWRSMQSEVQLNFDCSLTNEICQNGRPIDRSLVVDRVQKMQKKTCELRDILYFNLIAIFWPFRQRSLLREYSKLISC